MARPNNNKKSSGGSFHHKKRQWQGEEPLEIVDDLAHAATFAMMAPPVVPSVQNNGNDDDKMDDNEIEVDDEDDEEDSSDEENDKTTKNDEQSENGKDNDDDDDDDESDVDLAEQVAKMQQQDDDDEDGPAGATVAAPKTKNEVDAYQTPIQELEQHLQFQLTVQEDDDGGCEANKTNLDSNNLSLAGRVKHYMAMDRTVVVESSPLDHSSSIQNSHNARLDEGSLLVIRRPPSNNDHTTGKKSSLIPLGRIFEVFGPVTQPLYTIRLPPPPRVAGDKKSTKSKKADATSSKEEEKAQGTTPSNAAEEIIVKSNNQSDLGESEANQKQNPVVNGEASKKLEVSAMKKQLTDDHEMKAATDGTMDSDPTVEKTDNDTTIEVDKEDSEASKTAPDASKAETNEKSKGEEPKSSVKQELLDPWALGGEYAQLLTADESISVYYVHDDAKVIDTGAIMRTSGKGCGESIMSNRFATSVANPVLCRKWCVLTLLFVVLRCF
jgi:rRNA processing protein Gar1